MPRTLADDLVDDVAQTFHDPEHFAGENEIYRVPATGAEVRVYAIWSPYSTNRFAALRPDRKLDEGERDVLYGTLEVTASTTVARSDQWRIDGDLWQVMDPIVESGGVSMIPLRRDLKKKTMVPGRAKTA